MTLHKALHSRDDSDRLYVSRKEGKRGTDSIQYSVDASKQQLKDHIKKREGRLITLIRNNTDHTSINRTEIDGKKKTNSMAISSDKQAKSYTRKLRHGYERETLREKQNLS